MLVEQQLSIQLETELGEGGSSDEIVNTINLVDMVKHKSVDTIDHQIQAVDMTKFKEQTKIIISFNVKYQEPILSTGHEDILSIFNMEILHCKLYMLSEGKSF